MISSSDDWKEQIMKILTKISSRREAEDFKYPVRWIDLGLSDYPEIVEKPMDLGTVMSNLSKNLYSTKEECVADIRLIWSNSLLYNAPGSRIYTNTKCLSDQWEQLWGAISSDDTSKPPSADELKQWILDCHWLSPDDLGKLMKFIDNHCPKALVKKPNVNEIEVNADLIPGKVFRRLVSMIRQSYEVKPSNSNGSESSSSSSSSSSKKRKNEDNA